MDTARLGFDLALHDHLTFKTIVMVTDGCDGIHYRNNRLVRHLDAAVPSILKDIWYHKTKKHFCLVSATVMRLYLLAFVIFAPCSLNMQLILSNCSSPSNSRFLARSQESMYSLASKNAC